jgi:hypothetical protein
VRLTVVTSPIPVTLMENNPPNDATPSDLEKNQIVDYQWGIGWRLPVMLFGPLLAAFVIAIGHDQFLISLDGNTLGSPRRQLVVRGTNNGLATIASLLLGVALGTALVEIVCKQALYWSTLSYSIE